MCNPLSCLTNEINHIHKMYGLDCDLFIDFINSLTSININSNIFYTKSLNSYVVVKNKKRKLYTIENNEFTDNVIFIFDFLPAKTIKISYRHRNEYFTWYKRDGVLHEAGRFAYCMNSESAIDIIHDILLENNYSVIKA